MEQKNKVAKNFLCCHIKNKYKNAMKMMQEDGLFTVLPKSEDAWINFLNPFLRLTRKEKNIKNNIKKTIKVRPYE